MPRETVFISAFNKGIACGIDREDVSHDASVYAEDVDLLAPEGALRGRMGDATVLTEGVDEAAFLANGASWDLIYRQGTALKAVIDFYGTKAAHTFALPAGATVSSGLTFARRGKSLYIGCGASNVSLWVGYTPWKHFGAQDDGTLRCLHGICFGAGLNGEWVFNSVTEHAGTGYFSTSKVYFWKFCLLYNGYERGPLVSAYVAGGGNTLHPSATLDYADVTIRLTGGVGVLAANVTGLELYRAEMDLAGATSPEPTEYYALVASLDLTEATQSTDAAGEPWYYTTSGGNALFRYRDRGEAGYTYESQSGIPEALSENYVTYSLSAETGGYLFVAGCSRVGVPDASMMVFRSKAYRFAMFNWAEEYMVLPFAPVALAAWNGKLYAFDTAGCVKIDPPSLAIEETLPGVGASGKGSVLPTEAGLFVFSAQNVYLIGASGVTTIGDAVRVGQPSSLYTPVTLEALGTDIAPTLGWDARGGLLVAAVHRTGSVYGLLVFSVKDTRWEYWTIAGTSRACVISGRSGEVYVGLSDGLLHIRGGSSRKSATWVSRVLLFGRAGRKKVYKVKLSGTATVTYAVDDDTVWKSLSTDALASADWLCTRLQVKLVVSPSQEAGSLEVVYRQLEGVR